MADHRVQQFDNMAMDVMDADRYDGHHQQSYRAEVYDRRPPAPSGGNIRDFGSRGQFGSNPVRVLVNDHEWSQVTPGHRHSNDERPGEGHRSGGLNISVRSDQELLRADYLAEIHSSRKLNKVNKQSQISLSREDLVKLDRFEPIRVSFVDRKQGVEYDAYGQLIGPVTSDDAPECFDHHADPAPQTVYPPGAPEERLNPPAKAGHFYHHPGPDGIFYSGQIDLPPNYDQGYSGSEWSSALGNQPPTSGADPEWQGVTFTTSSATYPPGFAARQTNVPNFPTYLPLSIVVGVLFFFPIAFIAVSFAIQAKRLKKSGNHVKALELARRALHLNILAVVMGVIGYGVMGFLIWYQTKSDHSLFVQDCSYGRAKLREWLDLEVRDISKVTWSVIDPCNPIIDPCDPVINPCDPAIDLCDPVIDPCDPAIDLCDPVIDPCDPIIDPCHPAIDPCDPVIDPCDPVIDPCDPVIDPCDPVIDPCHPSIIDPCDPVIDPCDPVIDPCDPVIDPCDPAIDPCGPVIDPCDPAIDPCDPVIDPCDPVIDPCNPVIDPCNPVIDPSDPVIDPCHPSVIDPCDPVIDPCDPVIDPCDPVIDPCDPVIDPCHPVIDPCHPSVIDPCDPVIDPCDPLIDPCDPAIDPCDPVIDPCDPAIDPCDPVIDPCDPVIDPCNPVIYPCDPVIDPCDPVIDPCDPVIDLCHPSLIRVIQSVVDTCNPVIDSCDPVIDPCDPVIDSCDPVIDSCDPVIDPCDPVIDPCDPVIDPCDPVIDSCDPVIDSCDPVIDPCDPVIDLCHPVIDPCRPVIVYLFNGYSPPPRRII
ncbi:hypothetical protein Btru_046017 [Bulinus truncatus]|nr:hypothetical protein Btru_046017 [Bulinus truncatus]